MVCKTFERLLAAYEGAVKGYTAAARNLNGMLCDDFRVGFEQDEKLRQTCTNANHELMDHWRKEHSHLALHGNR
jgi:hypothetical protein